MKKLVMLAILLMAGTGFSGTWEFCCYQGGSDSVTESGPYADAGTSWSGSSISYWANGSSYDDDDDCYASASRTLVAHFKWVGPPSIPNFSGLFHIHITSSHSTFVQGGCTSAVGSNCSAIGSTSTSGSDYSSTAYVYGTDSDCGEADGSAYYSPYYEYENWSISECYDHHEEDHFVCSTDGDYSKVVYISLSAGGTTNRYYYVYGSASASTSIIEEYSGDAFCQSTNYLTLSMSVEEEW